MTVIAHGRSLLARTSRLLLVQVVGLPVAVLLVLAAAVWAFSDLAEDTVTRDPSVRLDHRIAISLHAHAGEPWITLMRVVTVLGAGLTLGLVTAAAAAWLARRRELLPAALVAGAFLGAETLTLALKDGFRRERPVFAHPLVSESSFSFPSGHALVSVAVYGALAYLVASRLRSLPARVACFAAAGLVVLAVGFSRLYLGAHFLSDVLAGYSAGVVWLIVWVAAIRVQAARRARRP
jgi:undecaprenyl-diphosphatase